MAPHEKPSRSAPVSQEDGATFQRILSGIWNKEVARDTPGPGFQEDAAVFRRDASDEAPALAESERQALALWRRWRAALARLEALDRQFAQARAAIPEHLRDGRKYLGERLSEDDAEATRGWPAITGVEVPPYGRIDIRPGPDDLLEIWRRKATSTYSFATDASTLARQARQARSFDELISDFAALGERVRAQREAERAVNYREIEAELEEAGDARFDVASEIYALDCRGPHAIAAVTLLRLDGVDVDDEDADRGPNASFWRAILAGLLPQLTGEIAEDAARALTGQGD